MFEQYWLNSHFCSKGVFKTEITRGSQRVSFPDVIVLLQFLVER